MQRSMVTGNVVATPELKTNDKGAWTKLRLASNGQNDTLFLDVYFSGRQAEILCQYAEKGRQLLVEFRIVNNSYEKDGVKVNTFDFYGLNFEFLGSKGKETDESNS